MNLLALVHLVQKNLEETSNIESSNKSNSKRTFKNVTTIITEEESNSSNNNQNNLNKNMQETSNEYKKSIEKPKEDATSTINSSNNNNSHDIKVIKNVTTIITEGNENRKDQNESINKNSEKGQSASDQIHNGRKIIKNVTTIITEEESNSSNNNQNNLDKNMQETSNEYKKGIEKPKEDVTSTINSSNNNNSHDIKIIKNVTTIITEENEERKDLNESINKNNLNESIDKNSETDQQASDQIHNGRKIIKNVTTIITEEEENLNNSKINQNNLGKNMQETSNEYKKGIEKPKEDATSTINSSNNNNSHDIKVIKNVTTIITEENENRKDLNESINKNNQNESINKNSETVQPASDQFHNGRKIIKNVTTIITEEENSNSSNNNKINPSPIVTRNESNFNNPKLPCESNNNFSNLRPIATIIETHKVIKKLFGTHYLSTINNGSFIRQIRKNVTKIIRPNSLDDATSMILDKSVSEYLVNEVHDIEEKVIFENSDSNYSNTSSPKPIAIPIEMPITEKTVYNF